jgi:[protein-PII] uridylyltransferase
MNVIAKQRDIIDRREIVGRLDELVRDRRPETARGEVLRLFKDVFAAGQTEIRRRFEATGDGRACMRAQSFLSDQIIRLLYDFAFETAYPLSNPTEGERITVIATGGYGRGELAPFSDIDLLFLLNYKVSPHTEQVIEYMLYMLWDLGLKVGHATRSIDECMRMAASDHTIRTALLESRYIWGDNRIYAEFRHRFLDSIGADKGLQFVEDKLAERDARHQRLGDSRYVLEPNIKEGKGGLRDLHTLYWIAKYLYRVDDVAELVDKGVFSRAEAARFRKAHNFLRAVRCHLHYVAGRAEERLTFDLQQAIAARMGFHDRNGMKGVERFMRYYYLIAKQVGDLTRIFCAALETAHARRPRLRLPFIGAKPRDVEGFVAEYGRLRVASDKAFAENPVDILRLFRVAQHHALDIHPETLRLITQNLKLIDDDLRRDPEANRLFLEMLTDRKAPAPTLSRLNEAGVFGRFIPDFGRVVARMQYDMYHVYTVDEHSIRAIKLLHRIETGELKGDHPLSAEILPKIGSRRALYVAALLHDIAKGRGGDHSKIGAAIAYGLCPRLGLNDEETETVAWLVLHHLSMSMVAQRRDIHDPQTIRDFAALVQSPERLKLLLVLTVVDMRATGPAVWNGWKAALLRDLYYRTEELMSGDAAGVGMQARVEAAKEHLRERLTDWPEQAVEEHLVLGYPGYWLSVDTDTHLRNAQLIRRAEETGERLVIDHRIDQRLDITEVTIYTPDHPGLFARLTGAMAVAGASIVDARIFTLTNGKALDIFWVQDAEGEAFDQSERLGRLDRRIAESLAGEMLPRRELTGRESLPRRAHVFKVPPRVLFDNNASATHTLIEVNGRDRPGLLYEVSRALTELGVQIANAKISTYGERVVDVFYVKDIFGMKIDRETKLAAIKTRLLQALDGTEDTDTTPAEKPGDTGKTAAPKPPRRRPAAE